MAAYRSNESDVWRGRVGAAYTPASDRFITRLGALALLIAGFGLSVTVGLATHFPSPRLLLALGALPAGLWLGFRKRRHVEQVAQRVAVDDAVARHRAFAIGGKSFAVRAALARDGKLALGLPYGSVLTLEMQGALAAEVVRALGVPDVGVRSVYLEGPITARLGNSFTTACGAIACTSALVLFSGSNLSTRAEIAFAVALVTCAFLTFFSVHTRRLVADESGIALSFLRRTRVIRYETIEDLSLDGCTLTLKVLGEAPQRFTLSTRRFVPLRLNQHEMNTLAFNDAVAPMEMAARHLARVR